MRYVVTGGAGFIGSNLAARLLCEGHRVYVVDNLMTGSLEVIRLLKRGGAEFIEGNASKAA